MRITAIVPTLDEGRRIGRLLGDLRAAGIDEIRVVDGGSRDDTVARARAVAGVTVLEAPRGRGPQLNVGARGAGGEVLWFVHADARVPPTARRVIDEALREPEVVAGAFRLRTVAEARHWAAPFLPIADLRSRYTRHPYGDQALFVRASVFRDLGGFAEQPLFEDLDLCRRLWGRGRIVTVRERVEVSGRRFLARPVYYTVVMNTFPMLYRLGVSPGRLARLYGDPR